MGRIRTRLPWSRGTPAAPANDAPFFEHEPRWGLRPDSPEVSVFTPEEEAESHRRWRRAVLRERLSGPLSSAEQLGLGLSAAALTALVALEIRPSADGPSAEEEAESHRHDDTEGAGEVFAALKSAAMGRADKAPVTPKPVGAAQTFLDTGPDNAFSTPVSSRADNGLGVRRVTARGSGAPLESRAGGAAERTDVTVLRKAEQAPGEARTSLPATEGPFAVRGAFEAEVVTMAIAMASDLPEVREDRTQAEAKGAGPRAVNQGQAPAEASSGRAKAEDESPAAEARADQRQGPAIEAVVRDKAGDAPAATVVEAKPTADQGRGTAEAPARAKANDPAAVATAATAESGAAERKGGAGEVPVEAKAKDVASTVGAEAGLGHKPNKAVAQAKAVEVEVVEAKTTGPDRSAAEASGPAKGRDAPPSVLDAKADATRLTAEEPEQAMAKGIPIVVGTEADRGSGPASAGGLGPTKAADVAVAEKAGGTLARPEIPVQATKAADLLTVGAKADQRQGLAVEALAPEKKIVPALGETKAEQGQRLADPALGQANAKDAGGVGIKAEPSQGLIGTPGQAKDVAAGLAAKTSLGLDQSEPTKPVKAADIPVPADAKAGGQALGGPAETLAGQALTGQVKAKDAPTVGTKPDLGHTTSADALGGQAKPKDVPAVAEAKADLGPGHSEPTKPAKANDVPPVVAEPKGGQVETPVGQTKTKDTPAPPAEAAKAEQTPPPAETAERAKPKEIPAAVEAKADPEQRPAEPPGQAKNDAPAPPVETAKAEQALPPAETAIIRSKQADPPAQAHDGSSAQNGDVPAAGAVSAGLPGADAFAIHVKDLWSGGEDRSEPSPSHVPPPEKAASPIFLDATDLMGANGERGEAAAPPKDGGRPDGGAAISLSLSFDEKGVAGAPDQAVPGSQSGKADGSPPLDKTTDAGPVGTKTQEAATGGQDQATAPKPPSGDATAGDGVVLPPPAPQGHESGRALAESEALAVFSAAVPDGAVARNEGKPVGKGPTLDQHMDPGTSASDGVWQYAAPPDTVLL